ncbi:MAG: hypothetical protein WBX38_04715 [Candidatus Sulfotelmatobacter sp.]
MSEKASITPAPPQGDADKLLLERAKFFREHVQAVLNLATGALVLSVTFLHDKTSIRDARDLRISWRLLVAAIFLGILYNYVLAIFTRWGGRRYGSFLSILSLAFHITFFAAVVYMSRFGLSNI